VTELMLIRMYTIHATGKITITLEHCRRERIPRILDFMHLRTNCARLRRYSLRGVSIVNSCWWISASAPSIGEESDLDDRTTLRMIVSVDANVNGLSSEVAGVEFGFAEQSAACKFMSSVGE
jgi:hypothetical protein